jgi:hypothetical protein
VREKNEGRKGREERKEGRHTLKSIAESVNRM